MADLPLDYAKLTPVQRREVRILYEQLQEGKCAYCKGGMDKGPARYCLEIPVNAKLFPPGFFKHRAHLHHDHKTGLTLGAVHSHCNAVLWQYHGE